MPHSSSKPRSEFGAIIDGTPLAECVRFWLSRREGRLVPRKSSIDPTAMPRPILPFVSLYERTTEGRFRCRLAGTGLCDAFQNDPTGRHLDELVMPALYESRRVLFAGAIDRALPVAYAGNLAEVGRTSIRFRRVLLPIAIHGDAPDGLFGMVTFQDYAPLKGRQRLVPGEQSIVHAWATTLDLIA